MPSITKVAMEFFEACEAGKGWDACKAYCKPDATFSAQAEPLADVRSLSQYADWMKGLMTIMPDGRYELGGQEVVVADRVARLAEGGSIAGSTLTMDVALRNAVEAGLTLVEAVTMASTTPARLLGLAGQTGSLLPGHRADVVVLTSDLALTRVMRSGSWVA